jgi:hypothetical protein
VKYQNLAEKVLVEVGPLKVACPRDEIERVRSLVLATDRRGVIHKRDLVLLFSWQPERHVTTTLRTALQWLSAEIKED